VTVGGPAVNWRCNDHVEPERVNTDTIPASLLDGAVPPIAAVLPSPESTGIPGIASPDRSSQGQSARTLHRARNP
jgi:hypothetical protein